MSPEEVRKRASAIRLDQKSLATLANRSQKFVSKTLTGQSSPRYDTLQDLDMAIQREEMRLRDYLLALHPVDQKFERALPT